jgi:hypothetical protein
MFGTFVRLTDTGHITTKRIELTVAEGNDPCVVFHILYFSNTELLDELRQLIF